MRRTILAYEEKKQSDLNSTGLCNLRFLKEAMQEVSKGLRKETSGAKEDITLEDRLGTTMRFLRAVENRAAGSISCCLHFYPVLAV